MGLPAARHESASMLGRPKNGVSAGQPPRRQEYGAPRHEARTQHQQETRGSRPSAADLCPDCDVRSHETQVTDIVSRRNLPHLCSCTRRPIDPAGTTRPALNSAHPGRQSRKPRTRSPEREANGRMMARACSSAMSALSQVVSSCNPSRAQGTANGRRVPPHSRGNSIGVAGWGNDDALGQFALGKGFLSASLTWDRIGRNTFRPAVFVSQRRAGLSGCTPIAARNLPPRPRRAVPLQASVFTVR